jgi:hypothetical protein
MNITAANPKVSILSTIKSRSLGQSADRDSLALTEFPKFARAVRMLVQT